MTKKSGLTQEATTEHSAEHSNENASLVDASLNKALLIEEALLFELDDGLDHAKSGVDLPQISINTEFLGGLIPREHIGLPNLSEPETVRHYTRLSQKNYGIDTGIFPLGSCTMKHNPRLNEKLARLPGFSKIHPLQPVETVQGALWVVAELCHWLSEMTGLPGVAFSPAAGAHGEWCGMMAIRSALRQQGQLDEQSQQRKNTVAKNVVIVPESAHGTNPATAARCGFEIRSIPANSKGRTDIQALKKAVDSQVAAIMLTNPNTCGLFEDDVMEIADIIHKVGGYFYCDGANFNALVGRVKVADLGVDAMHINLHKTFSTPHGGGGPGSGPVVLSQSLVPFAPLPWVVLNHGKYEVVEQAEGAAAHSFGRLKAYFGQFGTFVRALAYMMSFGSNMLKNISGDAVLNANYVLAELKHDLSAAYDGLCMHEALFNDHFLKGSGISTLDFAKAMIDGGVHPMTMYFPLVEPGAMLVEPTETESKQSIDSLIHLMKNLARSAKQGRVDFFKKSPEFSPRRRLDETKAARQPILRWKKGT